MEVRAEEVVEEVLAVSRRSGGRRKRRLSIAARGGPTQGLHFLVVDLDTSHPPFSNLSCRWTVLVDTEDRN